MDPKAGKRRRPNMAAKKRRMSPRKQTTPIRVSSIASMDDLTKIAKSCDIVEASSSGLLVLLKRDALIPQSLRRNLTLDPLLGDRVFLRLEDMELEISGVVARTQFLGKEGFLLAIDYSEDAPEYWRECLMDLLPRPGELD
jgi:hypothetical protein